LINFISSNKYETGFISSGPWVTDQGSEGALGTWRTCLDRLAIGEVEEPDGAFGR
jgi:hypothetical protein